MSSIGWIYSMTSFVTTIIAVIVVAGFTYTLFTSNKQNLDQHLVDKMAGDEGED